MKAQKLKFTLLLSLALSIVSCKKDEIENTTTTDSVAKTCEGIEFTWNDVTNPATGKTWMDRNLGASQVATSSTDEDAYGDLYQWGRAADGHQCKDSETTLTKSSTDIPGHGKFIIDPEDIAGWQNPKNDNLWQGVNEVNNPCPSGYRLPTKTEWEEEVESWSSKDADGAYNSILKLPVAGFRCGNNSSLNDVDTHGHYWSSTVNGAHADFLVFTSSYAFMANYYRAYGRSVRCIKD